MSFDHLMQTDFILFVRDCIDCLKLKRNQVWWPETLVFAENHYGPFEIFARSQSTAYFKRMRPILGIEAKEELFALMTAFSEGKLKTPKWDYRGVNPSVLVCYDMLSTLP